MIIYLWLFVHVYEMFHCKYCINYWFVFEGITIWRKKYWQESSLGDLNLFRYPLGAQGQHLRALVLLGSTYVSLKMMLKSENMSSASLLSIIYFVTCQDSYLWMTGDAVCYCVVNTQQVFGWFSVVISDRRWKRVEINNWQKVLHNIFLCLLNNWVVQWYRINNYCLVF